MENQNFNNRVFGLALIKSINSNFNADFTGQPRTLPDGRVYATDKALKYSVRHFINQQYPEDKVLYYKRYNEKTHPHSLAELYEVVGLGDFDKDFKDKPKVLKNILSCIDVRLFGSTFAPKKSGNKVNLSVHGTVQINHGVNQFYRDGATVDETYSEQISAPFRSDNAKGDEAEQATLGRQSKLREGHYSYHFSINPKNLSPLVDLVNKGQGDDSARGLTQNDINRLKEGLRIGVTHFDSSSKAGSDNELLLWVQLKEDSKKVLPSFTEMAKVTRSNGKAEIDLSDLNELLNNFEDDIESVELYYSPESSTLKNVPESAKLKHLLTGKDLN